MKGRTSLRKQFRDAVTVEGKVNKRKLFAKLFITLVAALYTLVSLGVALSLGGPLLDYFEAQDANDTTVSIVSIWYLVTIVLVAVWFMYRIYRSMIGEWTREIDDSSTKTDDSGSK